MDEVVVERVLRAVELVPPGEVVSYGDLGALTGTTPRYVGTVMRLYGANVAWWRVTNAAGDPPAHLRAEVLERWAGEGIPVKTNGLGCRIAEHRTDLDALARRHAVACADLPG